MRTESNHVSAARNPGVFVDGEMSMRFHMSHVAASCFSAMCQQCNASDLHEDRYHPLRGKCLLPSCSSWVRLSQRSIRGSAILRHPTTAISSEFVSRRSIDRLVAGARKYDHVTSLLRDRHWLPITERIEYKLCTLVYRCLHGDAPRYLADHVALTSFIGRRRGLRSEDISLGKCRELGYHLTTELSKS